MSGRPALDEVDRRILALLEEDARRTIADIAEQVNLSATPVKRRVERLERTGVIAGYTVVLDEALAGSTIEAFAELRIDGTADADEVADRVSRLPQVDEVLTTAGEPDALVRLRVADIEQLRHVIAALRRTAGVTGTKALIVLGRRRGSAAQNAEPAA